MIGFRDVCRSVLVAVVLGCGTLLLPFSAKASEGMVRQCSGCSALQIRNMVKSGPLGYVYVVDYENADLTLWLHDDGGEPGGLSWVEKLAVDPVVEDRFLYMMDAKLQAQAAATSSVVVNISPGSYNGLLFGSNPFGGFSNINAYDVINSATVRSQLGTNLASAMAEGGSGSALQNLMIMLNSAVMSAGYPAGFKIVITWSDGSQSVYKIDSSTADQAVYSPGDSRDANDNPIPDASITGSEAGNTYSGEFVFNSNQDLQDWVNAAINYGIPVTGKPSGSKRLSCSWDGRTLSCSYK